MPVPKLTSASVPVPADVPDLYHDTYVENFLGLTRGTGRLHLFAGDQKLEHLNDDFFGPGIASDDADPEHLFRIAADPRAGVSCLAVQHGLAIRYARDYPDVPLLIKLNSKTHCVPTDVADPISRALVDLEHVLLLRENGVRVAGIGYTVYTGSTFESKMLGAAARAITDAHEEGLIAVLWNYPRGRAVPDEKDPHVIAGAAGVAVCLGADFVKVNYPKPKQAGAEVAVAFQEAVKAAGRCRLITSGGSSIDPRAFLERLHSQLHVSGAFGAATGRNIHQKPLEEAVRFSSAIAAVIFDDADVGRALAIAEGTESYQAP